MRRTGRAHAITEPLVYVKILQNGPPDDDEVLPPQLGARGEDIVRLRHRRRSKLGEWDAEGGASHPRPGDCLPLPECARP